MSDFKNTHLYIKLSNNENLSKCIDDIRENCIALGDTIKALIPGFTDHSVKHMDSLWKISDSIFTEDEIKKFTIAEAFVLGASFYFHDLGMSLAATKEGLASLKKSDSYISTYNRLVLSKKLTDEVANVAALQLAARAIHANTAAKLAKQKIPGLDKYIIEKDSIRSEWSDYIGEISASHHWSINTVEQKLGIRGVIPSPESENIDLALVACALRIIDYAHINSERANYIEKLLRSDIDDDSILHWKAQENINGPSRQENRLKYVSNKPITDVEAWWLFYDMATGLDKEIIAVSEYLSTKPQSKDRFSLEGVQGVKNPKSFASLVRTANYEPVDVRFKPDSIERLVEILGGKTLYGNDSYAPLRELLQNSRDAILLRQAQENEIPDSDYNGKIIISIDTSDSQAKLTVKDNGIGMTSNIIENYLLGIASDYWNSQDFYNEFPNAKNKGFLPTGKFGIGFLSVFMIGNNVEVETERRGKSKLNLILKGLGKHGHLISLNSSGIFGTSISVTLTKQDISIYNDIELIVKNRAPMLTFPIIIRTSVNNSTLEPYWWKKISQKDFFDFTTNWYIGQKENENAPNYNDIFYYNTFRRFRRSSKGVGFEGVGRFNKWPGKQPEVIAENYRLMAIPYYGHVILCSKGIAIKTIDLNGLLGMVEVNDIILTASRNETLKWNQDEFIKKIISEIKPSIVDSLNKLESEGMLTSRFEFISNVAKHYGEEILFETSLPWVTMIRPPGDVKFLKVNEAKEIIKKSNEILICYETNPWKVEGLLKQHFPDASDDAVIIPVNKTGQPRLADSSNNEEDIVLDTLPNQFYVGATKSYKEAFFLMSVINIIAKGWEVGLDNIINSEWIRYRSDYLCVHLKKQDLL